MRTILKGDKVLFKQLPCEVVGIHKDKTLLLRDEDGDEYDNVSSEGVTMTAPLQGVRQLEPSLLHPMAASIANIPEMKELSTFERRFVEELIVNPSNNTAAYYRAGGSARSYGAARLSAYNLAHRDGVKAALDVMHQLFASSIAYDREKLMADLAHQYDVAMADIPVLDKFGEPTGIYKKDGSWASKVTEMRARLIGAWTDRLEVTGKDGGAIQHQHLHGVTVLSVEELSKNLNREERTQLLHLVRKARGEKNNVIDGRPTENSLPQLEDVKHGDGNQDQETEQRGGRAGEGVHQESDGGGRGDQGQEGRIEDVGL